MNKKILSLFLLIGIFGLMGIISAATGSVQIYNPLKVDSFGALLLNIAKGVGILIASLGTIMIILSGIFFLTSAGSPERINKAKATLTYAIVGIVIGICAEAIVLIIEQIIGVKGA